MNRLVLSFSVLLFAGAGCVPNVYAQQIWNLEDDWEIFEGGRQGPGMFFGPEDAWSIRDNDASTTPTLAFTDSTQNYFTPAGCTQGVDCAEQYIAGYAPGNQAAVFKVYANADPWQDSILGNLTAAEREKPADHNFDPDSGVLDVGDIGAVPGGGGGTGQIVWKAPRDMLIDASFEAYSVGTMLPVGATPNPNTPATQQVRVHFLVRDTPGTGPINPEGEPDIRLNGFIPESLGGNGREFISGDIAAFAVTAGQEVYIKVNPINPPANSSRNMIGFSKIEVRELLGVPGDFDMDDDVDGNDFLVWQRNPTIGSLTDWQNNYGAGLPLLAAATGVPEPTSICLMMIGLLTIGTRRRCNEP